jgi:hypothetical protein
MAFNDEGGAGVGGWLAFFLLVIAVFTPLAMVGGTAVALYQDPAIAAAAGAQWATLQAFEWSLAALVIAMCWYIAWRLLKVQVWQTVRITIAGLWIVSLGALIADFAGVSLILGMPMGELMQGAGVQAIRPLVFSTLWTAYFLRSKRVANTYRRDADPDEVAEVFG